MPIEIRELVIRATVEPEQQKAAGGCGLTASGGGKGSGDKPRGGSAAPGGGGDLVQECVREVLRILEAKRER